MPDSYIKDAYQKIYKEDEWEPESKSYELKLSAVLYNNPYVIQAAQTALGRVSRVLTAYFGSGGTTNVQQAEQANELTEGVLQLASSRGDTQIAGQAETIRDRVDALNGESEEQGTQGDKVPVNHTLVQALLKNDRQSAGQVGLSEDEEQNLDKLDAVINRDGNLREKMTMIFNGTLFNAGTSKEQTKSSFTLKRLFTELGKKREAANPALQQLDMRSIRRMRGGDVYDVSRLMNEVGRVGLFKRITAALGFSSRRYKPAEQQQGLGYQYYEAMGIGPSEREKALSMQNNGDGEQLMWKEGQAYAEMKNSSWVKGRRQQGFRLIAGPSGTTMRMMAAYKMLGATPEELLAFRLALIGWMGSSQDHSLYEILYGSHLVGVKGKEDLSEAARMYMTVDPLTVEQLRREAAIDNEFPHERVFNKMLERIAARRAGKQGRAAPIFSDYLTSGVVSNGSAQDRAINIYTTGAYQVMNPSQQFGEGLGWWIARKKTKDNGSKHKEAMYYGGNGDELQDKALSGMIRSSIRVAAAMGQDTLRERGRSSGYTGNTYRGMGILYGSQKFREGNTFTESTLTSTSKRESVAKGFYDGVSRFKRPVLVTYHMNGKSAVDIQRISAVSIEAEVLVPKDARFRVTKGLYRDGAGINRAEVEEVGTPSGFSDQVMENPLLAAAFQVQHAQQANEPVLLPAAPEPMQQTGESAQQLPAAVTAQLQQSGDESDEGSVMPTFTAGEQQALRDKLQQIKEEGGDNPAFGLLHYGDMGFIQPENIFMDVDLFVNCLCRVLPPEFKAELMAPLQQQNDAAFGAALQQLMREHGAEVLDELLK